MQRRPRAGRVVLVERRQLRHRLRRRAQLLDDGGACGERRPVGLIGERHGDLGTELAGERLDRVELDRGEIVEAVEEDRGRAPAAGTLAQRVERAPGEGLGVDAIEPGELVGVAPVDRGELARIRARSVRRRRPSAAAPS